MGDGGLGAGDHVGDSAGNGADSEVMLTCHSTRIARAWGGCETEQARLEFRAWTY